MVKLTDQLVNNFKISVISVCMYGKKEGIDLPLCILFMHTVKL